MTGKKSGGCNHDNSCIFCVQNVFINKKRKILKSQVHLWFVPSACNHWMRNFPSIYEIGEKYSIVHCYDVVKMPNDITDSVLHSTIKSKADKSGYLKLKAASRGSVVQLNPSEFRSLTEGYRKSSGYNHLEQTRNY